MYAKKAEDRRFRGNQSLALEDTLFERYDCVSVRVAHFFTHSREAPSLVDQVQYTNLARGCRQVVTKLWDIYYILFMGYDGRGGCAIMRHTLLQVTHRLISKFKYVHFYFLFFTLLDKVLLTRSLQRLPSRLVSTLSLGSTWASHMRLHPRFCSFLWHWSTMHQICPTARAI